MEILMLKTKGTRVFHIERWKETLWFWLAFNFIPGKLGVYLHVLPGGWREE
jgi:hypothetical protein